MSAMQFHLYPALPQKQHGSEHRVDLESQDIDESKVKAHYDKGVLSLELPKKFQEEYRKIAIG